MSWFERFTGKKQVETVAPPKAEVATVTPKPEVAMVTPSREADITLLRVEVSRSGFSALGDSIVNLWNSETIIPDKSKLDAFDSWKSYKSLDGKFMIRRISSDFEVSSISLPVPPGVPHNVKFKGNGLLLQSVEATFSDKTVAVQFDGKKPYLSPNETDLAKSLVSFWQPIINSMLEPRP